MLKKRWFTRQISFNFVTIFQFCVIVIYYKPLDLLWYYVVCIVMPRWFVHYWKELILTRLIRREPLLEQGWLTLPEHPIISRARVVKFVELDIYKCLVSSVCHVRCNFLVKRCSVRFHSHLFWRVHVVSMLFVFN